MGKTGSVFFAAWASACGRLEGRRQEAEVRGVSRAEDHHFLERILLFFPPPGLIHLFCLSQGRTGRRRGNRLFPFLPLTVFFASLFRGTWFLLWFNYLTDGRKNYNVAGCTTENRLFFFYQRRGVATNIGRVENNPPMFQCLNTSGENEKNKTFFPPVEISFEVFPSLGSSGVSASACVSPSPLTGSFAEKLTLS